MQGNRLFGEFLRSRRARLKPEVLGEATHLRRRTPGLKREEVARRAGISAEWYVTLEQGRAVSPSPDTVDALGRALMPDAMELAHLRALAGTGGRPPIQREAVPGALRRLVEGLPEPAYLTGQRWDMLAWNAATVTLFGDFVRLEAGDRNILHWMLTDPAAKSLFGDGWADEVSRMVSLFRATHDLWAGDVAFAALVCRLRAACREFDGWWAAHKIAAPLAGTKRPYHPSLGALRFDYASFQANDDPALKLTLYTRR